jgi:CubicO group peptidase (beta-lactamase class C family)
MDDSRVAVVSLNVILAGVLLSCAGCVGLSSRQIIDPASAAARLRAGGDCRAEVDRLAAPVIAEGEAHGMVVGIVGPGRPPEAFAYGELDFTGPTRPPAGETVFEIGSITKSFVAAVLDLLVQEGRLNYSNTVREILPREIEVSRSLAGVTLHELATHTAGLPRQPASVRQMHHLMEYVFTGRNPYRFIDKAYLRDYLRTCDVPPREKRTYSYSNLGYGLLAHLIEVKTGRPIRDLIAERICRPLDLRDTGFSLTDDQRRRLAPGHAGDQPKFVRRHTRMANWDMGDVMCGSGGMYSTANDLLKFARACLGQLGHPLDARLAATRRIQIRAQEEDVALGWVVDHFNQWNADVTYMNGVIGGYSAYLGMNAERRVAVVVLCNNFNWRDRVGHNLVLTLSNAITPQRNASIHTAPNE